jgi:hypothetical protein
VNSETLKGHLHPHSALLAWISLNNHHGIMASLFNCNTVHEALDKALELWTSVPQAAQWALAGIGALYVARGALSFLQLLLNCFILSGTNVRSFCLAESGFEY